MSRSFSIFFIVLLLLLFQPLQTLPYTESFSEWIEDGEYSQFSIGGTAGMEISGNCTLHKGDYIIFFICDNGNFTQWLDGHTVIALVYYNITSFYSFDFITPNDDTWHAVFSNVDLTKSGTRMITGYISYGFSESYLEQYQSPPPEIVLIGYSIAAFVGIFAVVALVIIIIKARGANTESGF